MSYINVRGLVNVKKEYIQTILNMKYLHAAASCLFHVPLDIFL